MKRIILSSLAFLAVLTVGYASVAFVTWESNPEQWTQYARGLFIILFLYIGVVAGFVTYANTK